MTQVTVTATYLAPNNVSPAVGRVTFTPYVPQAALAAGPFYLGTIVAQLDAAGHITTSLLASDTAGLNPSGWTYSVREEIVGRGVREYDILVRAADAGAGIILSNVAPAQPNGGSYVIVAGPTGATGAPGPIGPAGPATLERTFPSLRGRLVSVGTFATSTSVNARTTTGTHRVPFYVVVDATDLRCSFANRFNSESPNWRDTIPPNDMNGLKAALEINGAIYPLTVNGALVFNIAAGGIVQTDPLPVEVAAGSIVAVRVFIPAGVTWYNNHFTSTLSSGSGGFTFTTDLTLQGSAAIADAASNLLWTAHSITGTHLNSRKPVVLIVGDSIGNGAGDAVNGNGSVSYVGVNTGVTFGSLAGGGFVVRACRAAGIPCINSSVSGDTASIFVTALGHWQRTTVAPDVSNVVCQYGRNDVSNGGSLATVQASLIAAWILFYQRGIKVFQPTITPRTTSTDGWLTTVNQTAGFGEAVRLTLNAWLRDGAPMTALFVPVATGTSPAGTIRAGAPTHPLTAYFEAADQVETARDSGIWIPPTNLRAVSGISGTAAAFIASSATPQFSAADIGRKIVIPGAGTAGGLFLTQITAFNSTTSVSIANSIVTTVSGVAGSVGDDNTMDGLHPGPFAHALMATAVPTGSFVQ